MKIAHQMKREQFYRTKYVNGNFIWKATNFWKKKWDVMKQFFSKRIIFDCILNIEWNRGQWWWWWWGWRRDGIIFLNLWKECAFYKCLQLIEHTLQPSLLCFNRVWGAHSNEKSIQQVLYVNILCKYNSNSAIDKHLQPRKIIKVWAYVSMRMVAHIKMNTLLLSCIIYAFGSSSRCGKLSFDPGDRFNRPNV